ncbi:MAG: pyridoxal 5'-phosphate synthase lyase subunit PdxS [Candidatus Thermoplasmatota archaeon]
MMVELKNLMFGTELLKRGFAKMQKGGVIMDVINVEQAQIAEEAGALAVMVLEKVPADIRAEGGVARMADPKKIIEVMDAVTIPVMAKCRIGHTAEARILEAIGVDMIDESEVLTPADPFSHVNKGEFNVPFVCGARNLGEAIRRISEGAAMIRTKGEAGTGNVIEAVRHQKEITNSIRKLKDMNEEEIKKYAFETNIPYNYDEKKIDKIIKILNECKRLQRLPVVNFAAGGIATPADAALMMLLGSDGVFVGSGIFKSSDPIERAKAIVEAVTYYDDKKILANVSKGLKQGMKGIDISNLKEEEKLQYRGI